jgi:hypothetical protein
MIIEIKICAKMQKGFYPPVTGRNKKRTWRVFRSA